MLIHKKPWDDRWHVDCSSQQNLVKKKKKRTKGIEDKKSIQKKKPTGRNHVLKKDECQQNNRTKLLSDFYKLGRKHKSLGSIRKRGSIENNIQNIQKDCLQVDDRSSCSFSLFLHTDRSDGDEVCTYHKHESAKVDGQQRKKSTDRSTSPFDMKRVRNAIMLQHKREGNILNCSDDPPRVSATYHLNSKSKVDETGAENIIGNRWICRHQISRSEPEMDCCVDDSCNSLTNTTAKIPQEIKVLHEITSHRNQVDALKAGNFVETVDR